MQVVLHVPLLRSLLFYHFQLRTRNSMRCFVRRSVGLSVGPSVDTSRKLGKRAFPPLPTRPQLVWAVYPALFHLCFLYLFLRLRLLFLFPFFNVFFFLFFLFPTLFFFFIFFFLFSFFFLFLLFLFLFSLLIFFFFLR